MRTKPLFVLAILIGYLSAVVPAQSQPSWSGILKSTSGAGACPFGSITSVGQCAIDWTQTGIPGGIPTNWTQSGPMIQASACGNGSSDCTSTIQTALNACAGSSLPGKFVLLGPGTFLINGSLAGKNYCELRGSGPQQTTLNCMGSGNCIHLGVVNDNPYAAASAVITSGATAGSSVLTLAASSYQGRYPTNQSLAVGGYLVISELNNLAYVQSSAPQQWNGSSYNPCTYCDVMFGGTRLREQIVEITSISGTGPYTVGISPALYTDYGTAPGTGPAYATGFGVINGGPADCKYCGIRLLQIAANGTSLSSGVGTVNMTECAYCFFQGNEVNYTDGDWLDLAYCYRCEVRDNYFSNAFGHGAGGTDSDVQLWQETSASLIINNIMERGHIGIVVDLGAAGNVIAYNYITGLYDAVGSGATQYAIVQHGPFPQFNLFEGNVSPNFQPDSWHGNNGYNTVFRNWLEGTDTVALYNPQSINSITCSGGTCTMNLASPNTAMYAGEYVMIWGTSNTGCGGGSGPGQPNQFSIVRLNGSSGALSTSFSGGCSGATGGMVAITDLAPAPKPITKLPVAWATTSYSTYQINWGITVPAFSVGNNIIGNALGSDQQNAIDGPGSLYNSSSAPCTSCLLAPTFRPYIGVVSAGGRAAATTWNYDTSGDSSGAAWANFTGGPSNTAGYWSTQGFTTAFYHGNYDSASASTIWDVNASGNHTLPASFFLSSKPSWFGAVPWPAIGPDVNGGPDTATAGHANYIPAQVCYNNTGRDPLGIKQFDPTTCYGGQQTTQLQPPTGLLATAH